MLENCSGNLVTKRDTGRLGDIRVQNVRIDGDFDVLGHLDYVVRYGIEQEKEYSYRKFADEIDEILKILIKRGKGLEINMAGLKYGLPFAHPHPDILKRYRELGGEIITVGSDAHRPEHIAYEFAKIGGDPAGMRVPILCRIPESSS